MEELIGFLVVLGDVSILMEAKYSRVCCDGEGPEIINVGLERKSIVINVGTLGSKGDSACLSPSQKEITLYQ